MEKLIKKDKFGRKHISGIISKNKLTSSEIFNIAQRSVFPVLFKLYKDEEENLLGNGTAFIYKQIIDDDLSEIYLFTNLHVIQSVNESFKTFLQDPDLDFRLILKFQGKDIEINECFIPKEIYYEFAKNPELYFLDFAIIKVVTDISEPLDFFSIKSNYEIKEGNLIYALGYPKGLNLSISDGIVSHVYKDNEEGLIGESPYQNVIQHNILINPGNSGGPTVGEYGNIVGISTFMRSDSIGINFSLNIYNILEILKNPENIEKFNIKGFIESMRYEAKRILSVI